MSGTISDALGKRVVAMRILAWVGTGLKYVAGLVMWIIIFTVLQISCIFNVNSFIDGLWMEELHDGLVRNLAGKVAYRAYDGYGDFGCGDKYIYYISYRHGGEDDAEEEWVSLSSLVDVATWRDSGEPPESATYTLRDAKHKYFVHSCSDGTDISVVDQ